jgi:aminopeptidase N
MNTVPERLSDYAPPSHLVDHVEMLIALDPQSTRVQTVQHLRRNPDCPGSDKLVLNGRNLELLDIKLDGVQLDGGRYRVSEASLVIEEAPEAFTLEVTTGIKPSSNKSALGLFLDGENLVTHMEPDGFSRITYFQDRPDVLARYRVRLEADKTQFPVLLSNGNNESRGDLEGGRHYAVWSDPHPKPCYIFAIGAGQYEQVIDSFTTKSGRSIELGVYATTRHHGRTAFALDVLKRAMAWDEDVFGFEYDLDVFNILVLDTHAIAQENKGLNILEAALVSADPDASTDEDFDLIERIVGHEYFHNWTGNRITCRDWFQLSLKEGLTRYRDQMFGESGGAADIQRISYVRALRTNQFPEDSGGGAHPVQPATYLAVSNLYTATVYDKGAEIIRMLSVLLGEKAFIEGVSLYASRHDGQAVTIQDFLQAMSDASGVDLTQFSSWYHAIGTPTVSVQSSFDTASGVLTLQLAQSMPLQRKGEGLLHIPLRISFLPQGGELRDGGLIELRKSEETFTFEGFGAPPVVSINRGFSAPVHLEINRTIDDLIQILDRETDGVARWDCAQTLMLRAVTDVMENKGELESAAPPLIDSMGRILVDPELSPALKAELLTFVQVGLVADQQVEIDMDAIMMAVVTIRRAFASKFKVELVAAFHASAGDSGSSRDVDARGRRRLRAVCLAYLLEIDEPVFQEMALEEVRSGTSMTAKSAALYALCDHDCDARVQALQDFYDAFYQMPSVLRVWFRAQALSRRPGTASTVAQLSQHPAFDMTNTPLAMALFGGFFRQNRAGFHAKDGSGYRLLTDVLLAVDQVRPHGTRWLMPQVMSWKRLDAKRQALILSQLQAIASKPGISPALSENVQRALGGVAGQAS